MSMNKKDSSLLKYHTNISDIRWCMLFISTPGDGKSFLLDADNANVTRTYKSDPVHSSHAVVYNYRSDIIIVPQQKKCVFNFSPSMMQPTHKSFTTEIITALTLSPCGYFLVGGSSDTGCLFIWCAVTGELFRLVKSHIRCVKCIDFSSDGQFFASASSDSTVKIWRSWEVFGMTSSETSLKPLQNISSHTLSVECCKFFKFSKYLVTCSMDRSCRVFDAATGTQMFSHNTPHPLMTLAISPSDRGFVVGGNEGTLVNIVLYPSQDNTQDICNSNNSSYWTPRIIYNDPFEGGHQRAIIGISYIPSETDKIIATSSDGAILVWDITDPTQFRLVREVTRLKKGILHVCPILLRTPAQVADVKAHRSVQLSKYPIDSMSGSYQLPVVASLTTQQGGQTITTTEGAKVPHTYNKKKRKRMNEELANQQEKENEAKRARAADLAKKRNDLQELLSEFKKVTALEEKAIEKLSKLKRKLKK